MQGLLHLQEVIGVCAEAAQESKASLQALFVLLAVVLIQLVPQA
jgi:hypothetical protein